MTAGRKLTIGGLVAAGVTAYMAYLGASASWTYYLTVDECAAEARTLLGRPIRVSGKVAANTLRVAGSRKEAEFSLQGTKQSLRVKCSGPLPDNLAENIDVLVEGHLEHPGLLRADKVLTRCASKYQSQQPPASPDVAARSKPEGRG